MIIDRNIGEVEVANRAVGTSERRAAASAGFGLLIMSVAAIFAVTVHDSLLIPGDAAATAHNILTNELQFRLAVLSLFIVIVLDIVVAWGLYVFFKPANKDLSLLAAWLRVAYAAVFFVAVLNLVYALRLLHSGGITAVLDTTQQQALQLLNAFSDGWAFALGLFGLHLIVLGYLALQAGYFPKLLAALLVISGLGYLFDAVTGFLFPAFGVTIGQFTFFGEVLLAFWLVIQSVSDRRWQRVVLKFA